MSESTVLKSVKSKMTYGTINEYYKKKAELYMESD